MRWIYPGGAMKPPGAIADCLSTITSLNLLFWWRGCRAIAKVLRQRMQFYGWIDPEPLWLFYLPKNADSSSPITYQRPKLSLHTEIFFRKWKTLPSIILYVVIFTTFGISKGNVQKVPIGQCLRRTAAIHPFTGWIRDWYFLHGHQITGNDFPALETVRKEVFRCKSVSWSLWEKFYWSRW